MCYEPTRIKEPLHGNDNGLQRGWIPVVCLSATSLAAWQVPDRCQISIDGSIIKAISGHQLSIPQDPKYGRISSRKLRTGGHYYLWLSSPALVADGG